MADLAIGIDFGGCRVDELIGRGGMGVVYRGTDLRLDRPVAIKLIAHEHATEPAVRRRFEREARLMAAIDHPNVIPVYAAGEHDGHLYLVMRYVAGTDLHHRLVERGMLEPAEAARIVSDLGGALDAAHAAGLVHRDIKPANVLLADQHVYLTDFGITRAVDSGTRFTDSDEWVGTVDYMSPEHLRGAETDARSDVYALGCLLHTCLTGTPPFHRATAAATILAHIEDRPPKASETSGVPASFDPVLKRALAKRPDDRYPSAGELGTAAREAAEARSPGRGRASRTSRGSQTAALKTRADGESNGAGPADGAAAPAPADAQTPERTRLAPKRLSPSASPTARLRFYADRRRRNIVAATIGALLGSGLVALVLVLLSAGSASPPSGPLSSAEALGAARGFAAAYSARDARALGRLLAPDASRFSPTAVQHGRAAVLAEYETQFRTEPIRGYELMDPTVSSGLVGRVAAHYTVRLSRRAAITGTVVFGVERVDGRVAIGLIATQ